jgi:hypothetical protein
MPQLDLRNRKMKWMYLCYNVIFFYRFINGYAENLSNICSASCTTSVYSWKCKGECSLPVNLSGYLDQSIRLGITVVMLITELAQIYIYVKRLGTPIICNNSQTQPLIKSTFQKGVKCPVILTFPTVC